MITKALLVNLKAKPGKEKEVEEFLKSALPLVLAEEGTINWFAIKYGPGIYGIFDTFATVGAQQAHLTGAVANALMKHAKDLLVVEPEIISLDVFVEK